MSDQLADTQAAGSSTKQSRSALFTQKRGNLEHLHQTGPLHRLSSLTHLKRNLLTMFTHLKTLLRVF